MEEELKEFEGIITIAIKMKAKNTEEGLKILNDNPLDFKEEIKDLVITSENQEIWIKED